MSLTLASYLALDAEKKDSDWARTVITQLRMYMKRLVEPVHYDDMMAYLMDTQDMEFVKKLFTDPATSGVDFESLGVMEKIKNIIVAEIENSGIEIHVRAQDPTAKNQRQEDRDMLKYRKVNEALITSMNQSIGLPPFTLKGEKNESGKSVFNGDVDGFDEMGLDEKNDEDLDYYFINFHRLRHEIAAEEPINHYFKYNEIDQDIDLYVNDILSVKAIATKSYVNEVTGAIDIKYLCPKDVLVVPNKDRDFSDSPAIGYEENVTVQQFMHLVGDEFNRDTDMEYLLNSANAASNTTYTGVVDNVDGRVMCGTGQGKTCSFDQFLNFSVGVGYIEFKWFDANSYRYTRNNAHGNPQLRPAVLDRKMSANSIYTKEDRFYETTYKAYYILQGVTPVKLYKFGKLSYQMTEGVEDEYSNFSINAFRGKGKSATQICIPWIKMIHKAFAKWSHLVAKAKPAGRAYNYESLVKIAEHMFTGTGIKEGVVGVMKMFTEGINEIYTIPTTEDNQAVGGGSTASYELPHGFEKGVAEMMRVIDWGYQNLGDKLGFNGVRSAAALGERAGYKVNQESAQASQNATQYMQTMLIRNFENVGKRVLAYTQSIVKFKDKNSVPYKFMLNMLGDETVADIDSFDEMAYHRHGIFVSGFSSVYERQEIRNDARESLAQKLIGYKEYLLITGISNPIKAAKVLSYEQKRQERVVQQNAQAALQAQAAQSQQANQTLMQIEQMKINGKLQEVQMTIQGNLAIKQMEIQGELQKQSMKDEKDLKKIPVKAEADQDVKETEANLEAQKPLSV